MKHSPPFLIREFSIPIPVDSPESLDFPLDRMPSSHPSRFPHPVIFFSPFSPLPNSPVSSFRPCACARRIAASRSGLPPPVSHRPLRPLRPAKRLNFQTSREVVWNRFLDSSSIPSSFRALIFIFRWCIGHVILTGGLARAHAAAVTGNCGARPRGALRRPARGIPSRRSARLAP